MPDSRSSPRPGYGARPVILFVITEDWYFWSHRSDLATAAMEAGFDVALAARFTHHRERIEALGVRCYPLPFQRAGKNPTADLAMLSALSRVIKSAQASLVHAVAFKPILLCFWALIRFPDVRFCLAVTGLGHLFIADDALVRVLRFCLRPFLRFLMTHPRSTVILQNEDDLAVLAGEHLVTPGEPRLIRGAGVDTVKFRVSPMPQSEVPTVVLPARMLRDKGVVEFIEAVGLLHLRGVAVRGVLVGALDEGNPTALTRPHLEELCRTHGCEWWQHREDMPAVYAEADIVCLPSYREGLPKALLEGASSARPLVATDVPGCREICRQGESGLLVAPRDVEALAAALGQLLADPDSRARMGQRAREIVEREFSAEIVSRQTVAIYRELCLT
jgi:glycosyltransferase involved in cell wall biosynthesis